VLEHVRGIAAEGPLGPDAIARSRGIITKRGGSTAARAEDEPAGAGNT